MRASLRAGMTTVAQASLRLRRARRDDGRFVDGPQVASTAAAEGFRAMQNDEGLGPVPGPSVAGGGPTT